ncbi:MAG: hypothetical protein FJY56_02310 [Betaproteobacteria bacterium]|nr:hypothetical protein [Betaproteobacteria bacterium]
MQVVSSLDVAARQREITLPLGGGKATKTLFIGTWEKPQTPVVGISPQAYTVHQACENITHPHYHQTEQWQVIVEGAGKLGRTPVESVALHFTDPYTAYGPIVPERQGVTYFTLRARSDPGACMLADRGVKEAIRPSKRRFILKGQDDLRISAADAMRSRIETALDVVVEPHSDGLAAWMLRLPPGAKAQWPAECGGAGRHLMVAAGTLLYNNKPLPYESIAFAYPAEGGPHAHAGPDGAEVLIMQYPQPDPALLDGACAPYSTDGR